MSTGPATTALDAVEQALDALLAVELDPGDVHSAIELSRQTERLSRKVLSVQIGVHAAIEESGVYRADGHASGRVFTEHNNHLSSPLAKRRDRARRMLAEMPAMDAGLAAGLIGPCQIDRASRVFVNPRVQAEFVALDGRIATLAATLDYPEFDRRLTNWERQADEDGTADQSRRCHENRRGRITQDFDGGWELLARFGNLTGAQMHQIHQTFVQAEFHADWDEAYASWGTKTTVEHLARTFDQRDADALTRIFLLAADAHAAAPGGSRIDLSILLDHLTYERETRRAAGADPGPRPTPDLGPILNDPGDDYPDDPASPDGDPAVHPGYQFRCETVDGHPIDPREAFAESLVAKVRRAVIGWDGVVLDQSGLHTLYTGSLRHAVKTTATECPWPGCHTTTSHCQIDHLIPRRTGGPTTPANGSPECGRHNRLKEHGYTAYRDKHGRIHILRPDGTEID